MRKRLWWLGPLGGPLDRWLSGTMPSDPLYLSNQSFGKKAKRAALIALPLLVVGGLVAVALSNRVPVQTKPEREPTAAEVAARMQIAADIRIEANKDVQVLETVIRHGNPTTIAGTARNNTSRRVAAAELVFDLTDANGSQLGGVSVVVKDMAPGAVVPFQFPIRQKDAAFVLVRQTSIP